MIVIVALPFIDVFFNCFSVILWIAIVFGNYCYYQNIYNGFYGVKELSSPGSLHTEPKAHAEEEEKPEDEQRESALTKDITKDNPVLV